MNKLTRGVCYVAWGEQHVKEAEASALSCPYPRCLFTVKDSLVTEGVFDDIIRSDFLEFSNLHFFYRKLIVLQQTPYDITMYADSDIHFVKDADLGFDKADKFGFATVIAPGLIFTWMGIKYIHYNAGTLWFKGRPIEFVNKVLEFARLFNKSDEPAWSMAWDDLGINPAVLPTTYNLVCAGPIHSRPIHIWHSRDPYQTYLTSSFDDAHNRPTRG